MVTWFYPPQQAKEEKQHAEAMLQEYNKDRPLLNTQLQKLAAEKAKLEQDLKQMRLDSLSNGHQMDTMQANLDRLDTLYADYNCFFILCSKCM